jgi:hypothetical protein
MFAAHSCIHHQVSSSLAELRTKKSNLSSDKFGILDFREHDALGLLLDADALNSMIVTCCGKWQKSWPVFQLLSLFEQIAPRCRQLLLPTCDIEQSNLRCCWSRNQNMPQ